MDEKKSPENDERIEDLEVTELEDEDLEDASGGSVNGNCHCSPE